MGRRSALHPGAFIQGRKSLRTRCRRSALRPGDFLPDEKVTKESPRGVSPSGYSPWGLLSSPQRRQAPLPPERGASSDGTQAINRLPRHGLTAGSVPLIEPKEKIRPICPPTQSGKSVFFCGTNPIEGVAGTAGGAGAKSVSLFARSPSGVQGCSPGAPLGTFPATGKSPGVGGAERPPLGGSAEGAAGAISPCKKPSSIGQNDRTAPPPAAEQSAPRSSR